MKEDATPQNVAKKINEMNWNLYKVRVDIHPIFIALSHPHLFPVEPPPWLNDELVVIRDSVGLCEKKAALLLERLGAWIAEQPGEEDGDG